VLIFIKISLISTGDNIYTHGIRSISSYLKNHGHYTRLIFPITYDNKYSKRVLHDIKNIVKESNLIGVTCTSYTSDKSIQLINYLKQLKIPIIWGGIHATFNPEECIKYTDFVCIGEGEEAMLELADRLSKKQNTTKIRNLWVKENSRVYKNDVRPLVQDLDKLPHADYDFANQWILDSGKFVNISEKHFGGCESNQYAHYRFCKFLPEFKFSRLLLVHTVRGCLHQCTFCCNYNLRKLYHNKGTYIRKRSIKNVIEELLELKQKFPSIDLIWFTDDSFFIRSEKELEEFSREYKKKIDLPFMCYVDPLTFNETKLKLLLDVGLIRIDIGIQTGSEKINKYIYNRFLTNECLISVAKVINKYKHKMAPPEYQIIIANPYEIEQDVLATINLLQNLPKPYHLQPFGLVFFPGTQLFYKAINDGIIKSQKDSCYSVHYTNYVENFMIKSKKLNTLYLNLILALMGGRVTISRYGWLHRYLFKLLINKSVTHFFNKFEFIIKFLLNIYSLISLQKRHYNTMIKKVERSN
jgi:radical SAM superfamily enzyme YgiQ (UPF0313 family)